MSSHPGDPINRAHLSRPSTGPSGSGAPAAGLRLGFAALWRGRWIALAVLVVELLAVVLWLQIAPRSYTAVATVTATPQQSLLNSTGNLDYLETTLAQIVESGSLLQDVRDRLPVKRSLTDLRDEVTGERVVGTLLIRVTVVDRSAKVAAQIANTVTAVLPLHDPSGGLFLFTATDRAEVPTSASSPNVKIVLLAGIVLGLVLAVAAALLRDALVGTVDSEDRLRDITGAGLLAALPRPRDPTALDVGQSEVARSLRSLRVDLEFAGGTQPINTVVIASAVPDPADEWLAANLAVALAEVRYRVLLIDARLRSDSPRSEIWGHPDLPGMYDVLRGAVPLSDALIAGPVDGLRVLPVGNPANASPATLVELNFHTLRTEIGSDCDIVLVLAPAVTDTDDARVMAINGAVLLSVPTRRVRARALRQYVDELEASHIRLVGSVVIGSRR